MQNDNAFQSFLEETDTFLLLNGKGEDKGRIRFVHRRLNDNEYRSLFMRSDIILMAYPETFIYSVSGVSFECAKALRPTIALFGCTGMFIRLDTILDVG